jgi:prefoldin subunit 5
MNLVYLVLGFFVILFLLLVPTLEFQLKLRRRAKNDYRHARGTTQRVLIESCLENLNREISSLQGKIRQLQSRKSELQIARDNNLELTLTTQIVNKELDTIPGIGKLLKDRILKRCFNGTLDSLVNAQRYVHGIGDEKNSAIRQWVRNTRAKMPQLLHADFPGKHQILTKYAKMDRQIDEELQVTTADHESLQQLKSQSTEALERLRPVDTSTFLKAHQGDEEAAQRVTQYLVGIYPEWKRSPPWFKTLTETYKAA